MTDPSYIWNPICRGYYPRIPIQTLYAKPKVVNIPIHFVGSGNEVRKQSSAPAPASTVAKSYSRVAAAVAIQKAVRGFLVRKNMRVVRRIAAEVDEIERKLGEEVDAIRLDPRERLRLSEELMSLLLRLDSVRWVRNFRKKVIRRIILLQEAVDSISADGDGKIDDREASVGVEAEDSSIVRVQTLDFGPVWYGVELNEVELRLKNSLDAGSGQHRAGVVLKKVRVKGVRGVLGSYLM